MFSFDAIHRPEAGGDPVAHRSFHRCNGAAILLSSTNATLQDDTQNKRPPAATAKRSAGVNSLIWLAVVLFIIWIVVRVVFAITSFVFHLIWVVALILLIVWLARRFL